MREKWGSVFGNFVVFSGDTKIGCFSLDKKVSFTPKRRLLRCEVSVAPTWITNQGSCLSALFNSTKFNNFLFFVLYLIQLLIKI